MYIWRNFNMVMKIVYFQREEREMNSGGENLENVYIYV